MKNKTKVYVGMDVHKDSVMIAVFPEGVREPTVVKRLSHNPRGLRRLLDRLARQHEVRACYEASGAGYVLERMIRGWGHACEIVAPSLIPRRPGEQRKHDRKDAEELARLYRAGELVTIRVPTEREERVRDVVRCRGVFQREILKSRHYILKFLARRGLVYREGKNWTGRHMMWLRAIQRDAVLKTEDQVVFGEYLALLDYKVDRRDELDRRIEALALEPSYREAYQALLQVSGEVDWRFHVALVLAHETGHRIGAIRKLRWSDIDMDGGVIRWRAEHEKTGYEHKTPVTAEARSVLKEALARDPGTGNAPVLTAPRDPSACVGSTRVHAWWNRAERLAGLEPNPGRGWHSLRRKFASDLMDLPLKVLCELGGWKDAQTVLRCYQQADEVQLRKALDSRRRVRA